MIKHRVMIKKIVNYQKTLVFVYSKLILQYYIFFL